MRVGDVDYTADHILVAVGGRPTIPTMEGGEHCINSNGFFLLEVCMYGDIAILVLLKVHCCLCEAMKDRLLAESPAIYSADSVRL